MTPVITDISPAEQLITLITNAVTLTDDQKDLYLEQIFAGKIPTDLRGDKLKEFCAREAKAAEDEIAVLDDGIDAYTRVLNEENERLASDAGELLTIAKSESTQAISDFKQTCVGIDRLLDQAVEDDKKQNEKTEVDALRSMLKQDPPSQ